MIASISLTKLKSQQSVRIFPKSYIPLVYCTVKLRFPEDILLKKSINFITDNVKDFNAKETALTVWAIARMNYPSVHIQNLMLRKVERQVKQCLENPQLFAEASK